MQLLRTYLSLIIIVAALFTANNSVAQSDKRAARKAEKYFINANFDKAAELYSELSQKAPTNFDYNFRAGISWFYALDSYKKLKALPFLEAASKAMGTDTVPEVYYYLGRTYHLSDRYNDAISSYSLVKHFIETLSGDTVDLNEIRHYIEMCESAKQLVSHPLNVQVENLGDNVNSPAMEYAPAIPADGSTLVFTSRRAGTTGGKTDDDGMYYEDIYSSKKKGDGWEPAQNAGDNVNTKKHDASITISPDGQRLYLYRAHDVWVSKLENGTWSKPVKLLPDVNSKSYEPSVTLSADESTIFFVSERKGGYGGKDIYRSTKLADGKWSAAENLGPAVNTAFDEDSPFLTSDGKTLYFASQGHNSMGGYDIFSSRLENNVWSASVNLGYPINSAWDDIFYVHGNNGHSYYSTIKSDTRGDLDIYMISYGKKKKGVRLIFVAKSSTSKDPVSSTITLASDSSKYTATLPNGVQNFDSLVPGRSYTITAKAEGFREKSITFTLPEQVDGAQYYQEVFFEPMKDASGAVAGQRTTFYSAFFDIEKEAKSSGIQTGNNLDLYSAFVRQIDTNTTKLNFEVRTFLDSDAGPLASGNDPLNAASWNGTRDSLRFAPLLFDYHSASLRAGADAYLNEVYQYLAANKNVLLEIHGHTDGKGSEQFNIQLSKQRADAVAGWLKQKGIPASRLKVIAHGSNQPVAPNQNPDGSDDPAGREKNRRVQLITISPSR
jgi:outer membrane protein OmpA-like peptidoglycan-associated protein